MNKAWQGQDTILDNAMRKSVLRRYRTAYFHFKLLESNVASSLVVSARAIEVVLELGERDVHKSIRESDA